MTDGKKRREKRLSWSIDPTSCETPARYLDAEAAIQGNGRWQPIGIEVWWRISGGTLSATPESFLHRAPHPTSSGEVRKTFLSPAKSSSTCQQSSWKEYLCGAGRCENEAKIDPSPKLLAILDGPPRPKQFEEA